MYQPDKNQKFSYDYNFTHVTSQDAIYVTQLFFRIKQIIIPLNDGISHFSPWWPVNVMVCGGLWQSVVVSLRLPWLNNQ